MLSAPNLAQAASHTVAQILSRLPPHLRLVATPIPVLYLPRPDPASLLGGYDPDLLGLFEGPSRLEADPASTAPSPRIILFLENLWDQADHHLPAFRTEVRTTYLHELGHFLGFDENDLAARHLD